MQLPLSLLNFSGYNVRLRHSPQRHSNLIIYFGQVVERLVLVSEGKLQKFLANG
jgi:hypothetical protein